MKKILAVFLLALLVFSLSSCFPSEVDYMRDDIPSYRQDEEGVYYTSLDIGVKSQIYEDENGKMLTQFELLVGLRSTVDNYSTSIIEKDQEKKLCGLINSKTGMNFEYFGVDSVGDCCGAGFVRYSFTLDGEPNILDENDKKFGFFFINRSFTLINPLWVESIKDNVYSAVTELFSGYGKNVKIDNEAIRLRYYFAVVDGFYADNAVEVYDPVQQIEYYMWEETDNSVLAELPIYYKSMASGWYIVPILAGVIVVLVLTFIHKGKSKESVFLTEQPLKENDVYNEPVGNESDVSEEPYNKENDALEGQITMEEIITMEESEDEND